MLKHSAEFPASSVAHSSHLVVLAGHADADLASAIVRAVVAMAESLHMDVVAESVKAVYDAREQTHGLKMVFEPKYLRFFQARFEPV